MANTNNNNTNTTTGATANTTTKQGNDMNTNTNTPTAKKHYKLTVIEMLLEASEKVAVSKKTKQMVSVSGNNFSGLNNAILALEYAEKGYKSNVFLTEKQMVDNGLELKDGVKYGTQLFSTKIVEKDGKKKKQVLYYTVFNAEQTQDMPI